MQRQAQLLPPTVMIIIIQYITRKRQLNLSKLFNSSYTFLILCTNSIAGMKIYKKYKTKNAIEKVE